MRLGLLETYDLSFEIEKSTLLGLLRQVTPVIPTKDNLPALTNFHVSATADMLRITGTDLSAVVTVATKDVEIDSPGKALLPAKALMSIVSEVPNDSKVTICAFDGKAWVGAEGSSGPVQWELPIHKVATYPAIDTKTTLHKMPRLTFATALESVKVAVSRDTLRPAGLMSICASGNTLTTCDGNRLHQFTLDFNLPFDFNLPAPKVDLLLRMLALQPTGEVIAVGENDRYLFFSTGTRLLMLTKFNAEFPNVERVLLRPALENNQELTVNRAELIRAIKQVRIAAEAEACSIVMDLTPGVVELSSKDRTGRRATATLKVTWGGAKTTLVFNHKHLLETLESHMSESVVILLGVDTKLRKTPLLIKDSQSGLITILQQLTVEL